MDDPSFFRQAFYLILVYKSEQMGQNYFLDEHQPLHIWHVS